MEKRTEKGLRSAEKSQEVCVIEGKQWKNAQEKELKPQEVCVIEGKQWKNAQEKE